MGTEDNSKYYSGTEMSEQKGTNMENGDSMQSVRITEGM